LVVAAVLLSAVSAYGQRERRREGYDPADMLRRMDDNKNGMIEPSEVSGQSRMFIDRAADKASLDKSKAMPVDKLLPAMQAISEEYRKQREGGESRGPGGPSSVRPPSSGSSPTRPSSGFGAPPSSTPTTSSSGFGATSGRAASIMSLDAKFDQSVIDYVNGTLLREQDKNGDGHIDKAEWTAAGTWSKSNPPENSDLNKDGKLSREELCIRVSKSRGIPVKGETISSSPSPLSSPYGPPSGYSGGSSSDSGDKKTRKYAEGLLRDYDKNRDGMLQRDEWKEMKTEHQGADSNGDGTITLDELTTRISAYSSGGASSSPLSSSGSHSYGGKKGSSDKSASTTKKSYRFLTPTERLPKGMPDWFIKNDADGDGQIMMAEYAASFTETIAAEFAKYDQDGDGIITPNECLAVEKKK
jgi:Ca2+-binding EF-hand superfamily protein